VGGAFFNAIARVIEGDDAYPGALAGCRPHCSAAATRREIAGWEWKKHSTHFEGDRSARFWSASLFMQEMNGTTVGMD
jgi:hypothetical protein